MAGHDLSRRRFLGTSAALAGAALVAPLVPGIAGAQTIKRTAIDQVTLGKTGIKLSRLGMGTGVDNGRVQKALGKEKFCSLIRYAYDKGITFFDTCDRYETADWMADALRPLPREKVFVQSKITGQPADIVGFIDQQRKKCDTDYIDSFLIHSQTVANWTSMDSWKRVMDGILTAQERKWIRARGVSCHNLPALTDAVKNDWSEVHLVRVNPQGKYVDGPTGRGYVASETWDVKPVIEQIKLMHAQGRGIIGMKIIGNGLFTDAAEREKSVRFAMAQREIDAVVIGFKAEAEIDEAIQRIDAALAAA
jgi:predicted aldo/keto reductase-like oxidoreductase